MQVTPIRRGLPLMKGGRSATLSMSSRHGFGVYSALSLDATGVPRDVSHKQRPERNPTSVLGRWRLCVLGRNRPFALLFLLTQFQSVTSRREKILPVFPDQFTASCHTGDKVVNGNLSLLALV